MIAVLKQNVTERQIEQLTQWIKKIGRAHV